jgi:hypothetical protein
MHLWALTLYSLKFINSLLVTFNLREATLGRTLQWIIKERLGKWKKHGVGYVWTGSRAQLRIV